jgi:hypothetical protein
LSLLSRSKPSMPPTTTAQTQPAHATHAQLVTAIERHCSHADTTRPCSPHRIRFSSALSHSALRCCGATRHVQGNARRYSTKDAVWLWERCDAGNDSVSATLHGSKWMLHTAHTSAHRCNEAVGGSRRQCHQVHATKQRDTPPGGLTAP